MVAFISDQATPFSVEVGHDPAAAKAANEEFFGSHHEAAVYAEEQSKRFRCVWMSELGFYETRTGHNRKDWIYFWWSPNTDWGELHGRRTGFPAAGSSQLVSYVPLSEACNCRTAPLASKQALQPFRGQAPDRRPYRFTNDNVEAMQRIGVLGPKGGFELIDGVILMRSSDVPVRLHSSDLAELYTAKIISPDFDTEMIEGVVYVAATS